MKIINLSLLVFLFVSITIVGKIRAAVYNDLENDEKSPSLRRRSRFLAQQKLPSNYTCNKFPRVCRLAGSGGPDCCNKKCVNVKSDRVNCGMCGYKCRYAEICCRGKCVNASFDRKHCGGCNRKCRKGQLCAYGMCSYA